MNQTQNLHLPQWEESDRIMRTDFNDAMASIDAGVKAANDAIAAKANASALTALQSAMPRIVIGTYTGDGEEQRTVALSGQPQFLMVWPTTSPIATGLDSNTSSCGIATRNGTQHVGDNPTLELTSTGFRVFNKNFNNRYFINTNAFNTAYSYLAVYF